VPADYGYVNARVRGLRSRLLPDGFVAAQVDAGGFAAFTGALAQTAYARDLEEAQSEHTGLAAVDRALARSYLRATETLLSSTSGTAHALIALMLRRHDLANLKAVARGRHAERDADAVMAAVLPAGELGAQVVRSMAEAPDLGAAGQVLALARHPLAEAFRRAAAAYAADGDLLAFEVALDRAFYRGWSEDAERLPAPDGFRRLVAAEVDAANLRTALKLRGRDGDLDRYFVEGGASLSGRTFLEITRQPTGDPLPALTGPLAAVGGAATLSEVEVRLAEQLDAIARRLSMDPLDIGLVTDYLRRKERETAQLRLLARGTYYGVPRAALAKELGDA
jgi:V/A-type H+/Na+-transporting ATPase subunit C